ncbi:hypothetical protein BDV93DRAFT_560423 [Ceratobasidium sp. AG-I]|nr:hypothetical protein BDV93DRAFT_560423 [Ceratobasidium sp. AG-I]
MDEDPLGLEPAKARARVAMRQASEEDGKLLLKPNQFIVRLMTSRNTNARKPFVKEMRKRVVPYYGFSARTDEATMQMNRLNCEALLNDGRFLVANHTLQELVGPYMCPLFFNVIKVCCFTSKNAIGTRAAGGWSSISLSFLAFVATVAQHCVSEWVSGECVESPFSAEKYEGKFLAHHKTLKQQRAEASASMDLYCKSLVERASRDHTKSTGSGGNTSASVPDHIVRDWAVRYDVTSRNLARDSTFTGGLAFRVEQPQSSNITGVHIERLITSTNSKSDVVWAQRPRIKCYNKPAAHFEHHQPHANKPQPGTAPGDHPNAAAHQAAYSPRTMHIS